MLFSRSTPKNTGAEPSKVFTGRGVNEDDARANAEIRYNTWSLEQKRAGQAIEEVSREYVFSRRNEVNCKCDLLIVYRPTATSF